MSRVPLLCFPPAGAGGSFFHDWRGGSPAVDVVPIELPGREKRFAEEPHTGMAALIAQLLPELRRSFGRPPALAVFGHSFGAIVAYEVTRALAAAGQPNLTLIVSGAAGPGVPRRPPVTGLSEEDFLAAVRRIAGYRHPALDDPELRELLLPALRADVALQDDYRLELPDPLLEVPVVSLRGAEDDLVDTEAAEAWRSVTAGRFQLVEPPGGHMYLVDSPAAVVASIADALSAREAR